MTENADRSGWSDTSGKLAEFLIIATRAARNNDCQKLMRRFDSGTLLDFNLSAWITGYVLSAGTRFRRYPADVAIRGLYAGCVDLYSGTSRLTGWEDSTTKSGRTLIPWMP
jgi:hypothetical protein